MTRSCVSALASVALLCGISSLAESPVQQPAPPSSPAPSSAPAPAPKGPRPVRNIQYRVMGGGDPGMRPEMRIAPPGMWWKNPDIVQKLSLTSDQQKRMDDIFQQSRLQLIDLKANVEKQEVMLEPMLSATSPDTNKILAQIDHVASARAELEKANARMLLGIRGVLSADQWTKLQAEQRDNQRFLYHFKGGPGGPEFGPKGHGPEGLMILPGRTEHFEFAPGALSMLVPPSLPSMPEMGISIGGVPPIDLDGPEIDISPDVDIDR
jgi:Spy/CpxP family protein refolding chaperone